MSISVVIPFYNGARFIGEALASVAAQTRAPLEIIVIDDGSRCEEARALDREARGCRVIHLPSNRGQAVARNVGIVAAEGDWIAFLDCDDLWEATKLERQAEIVQNNRDCRAVHCGLRSLYPNGKEVTAQKSDVTLDDFFVFPCPVFPSAVMMQRAALIECGLFDPTFRCCEDLDLFLRFCIAGEKFFSVSDPLVVRRVQPDGVSRHLATFWSDADRIYRDYLRIRPDDRGRRALQEVHTDMGLRALYARDFGLFWRMLRLARRKDVFLPLVAGHVASRLIRNRRER
jgi:glycosyltransferase involved in cell wall biosynthesis